MGNEKRPDNVAGPFGFYEAWDVRLRVRHFPANQRDEFFIRFESSQLLGQLLHRIDRVHR